jgi:hypothetical protein
LAADAVHQRIVQGRGPALRGQILAATGLKDQSGKLFGESISGHVPLGGQAIELKIAKPHSRCRRQKAESYVLDAACVCCIRRRKFNPGAFTMRATHPMLIGLTCLALAACGLTETATSAATIAAAKAKEAEQAKKQLELVQQQLDAVKQQQEAQLKAAEKATE